MSSAAAWKLRRRNYAAEQDKTQVATEPASTHPLQAVDNPGKSESSDVTKTHNSVSTDAASVTSPLDTNNDPLSDPLNDPLSASAGDDPLSNAAADVGFSAAPSKSSGPAPGVSKSKFLDESFEPWEVHKHNILARFVTEEKLTITSSFLPGGTATSGSAVSDKVKNRLEQLDEMDDQNLREEQNLTQKEYEQRIENLRDQLIHAWDNEQRVKSLKIAIQCAKLLADVRVMKFYPTKFVLITDILDTFGKLVFDRIMQKSATYLPGSSVPRLLPENFTPDMVPDSSKEICRNWFYKIASIRELIPRLFVEASILKCYSFLQKGAYENALTRLASSVCGIGDPLVAAYARCYLCRVGVLVVPQYKEYLMTMFKDFAATYSQLSAQFVKNELTKQRIDRPSYIALFSPAVGWLLQCLAYKASSDILTEILSVYETVKGSSLLVNAIMSAFPPQNIAARAVMFTSLIRDLDDDGIPRHHLFRTLGLNLVMCAPEKDDQRKILNEVWKIVMKLTDPHEYMLCAEVWIEFPLKNFGRKEVNALLSDIIKHVRPDRQFEKFYPQLQSILEKVLQHMRDFSELCAMDSFLSFMDLFQAEHIKIQACRVMLQAFGRNQAEPTNDAVVLNGMMYVSKMLHDTITAMTVEDERRQIATLINGFLSKVSFARDFEQTLNFFVEARANFCNLDAVLSFLVHSTNGLIMQTRNIVKGRHTKRTAAFVRSCVAYTFITIPSVASPFDRLRLYLESAAVAVVNQALGQADALIQAGIGLIPEIPAEIETESGKRSTGTELASLIQEYFSTLLMIPDNPEKGALLHFGALLDAVKEYEWSSAGTRAHVQLSTLHLLAAYGQEHYLYAAPGVDANDDLYANAPRFHGELQKRFGAVVQDLQEYLSSLSGGTAVAEKKSRMTFRLLESVLLCCDMSEDVNVSAATTMWKEATAFGVDYDAKKRVEALVKCRQQLPGMSKISNTFGI